MNTDAGLTNSIYNMVGIGKNFCAPIQKQQHAKL